jgi:riboflavin kinase/FMN adenylyltransferase
VVVQTARTVADRLALPLVVLTFDPHPMSVVRPGTEPPAVATVRHRVELLGQCGADAVLVLPFDTSIAAMTADEFVDVVLVHALGAHAVVVGEDFRFGHRAGGDVELLRERGAEAGFELVAVSPVGHEGVRWSSTEVRRRVEVGDVAGAAAVLGHVFEVEGPVVRGDQRGRDLGYPTANVASAPGMLVPADGVYAGYLRRLDAPLHVMPAAVSVGTNPTFDGSRRAVEAHVLDTDALDLYDVEVAVSFVARLREQRRFDDVGALVAQMARDVAQTRVALATVDASALSARRPM